MKKPFTFFLFAAIAFALGAVGARFVQKEMSSAEPESFSKTFQPAAHPVALKPFTIVIIAYNNGAFVEKTIDSVFSQVYDHYRVVYVDDASDDGSFDMAREVICRHPINGEISILQNEERLGVLANLFRVAQDCADDEIIVVLNAEDRLAHEWVLQRLNAYYADPDLWIACAQSIDHPTFQKGPIFFKEELKSRAKKQRGAYLKSFYAALFKKIKDTDLIHGGKFLKASAEFAYMTPMLEMADEHFFFIPEVLYLYNQQGVYREDREAQLRAEKHVRSLKPYAPLESIRGSHG